ncbi:MAG: hypothetical protein AAF623_13960 [Planctomycetota bacterium]
MNALQAGTFSDFMIKVLIYVPLGKGEVLAIFNHGSGRFLLPEGTK